MDSKIKNQNGQLTPSPNSGSKKTPARSSKQLPDRIRKQLNGSSPNSK